MPKIYGAQICLHHPVHDEPQAHIDGKKSESINVMILNIFLICLCNLNVMMAIIAGLPRYGNSIFFNAHPLPKIWACDSLITIDTKRKENFFVFLFLFLDSKKFRERLPAMHKLIWSIYV